MTQEWTEELLAEKLAENKDLSIASESFPSVPRPQEPEGVKVVIHRKQPERAFQDQVIALAQTLGFKVHAERHARTKTSWRTPVQGDPGWLDLFLAHPLTENIIVLELKVKSYRLPPHQKAWHDTLRACGLTVFVKRPQDWDWIVETLTKLAGRELK